jgi:hypothetical protein
MFDPSGYLLLATAPFSRITHSSFGLYGLFLTCEEKRDWLLTHTLCYYVVYWMAHQLLLVQKYLSGYGIEGSAVNDSIILASFQK